MRIRDYRKHTYKLCLSYCKSQSYFNRKRLIRNLSRWATLKPFYRDEGKDYGYKWNGHDGFLDTISYCSDRMNQGRAKAILRLFMQETTNGAE